jgi:hypothetical protein
VDQKGKTYPGLGRRWCKRERGGADLVEVSGQQAAAGQEHVCVPVEPPQHRLQGLRTREGVAQLAHLLQALEALAPRGLIPRPPANPAT